MKIRPINDFKAMQLTADNHDEFREFCYSNANVKYYSPLENNSDDGESPYEVRVTTVNDDSSQVETGDYLVCLSQERIMAIGCEEFTQLFTFVPFTH